jgi:uncharacterized protein
MTARATSPALAIPRASINRYLTLVLALGIPLLAVPAVAGLPIEPFLLALTYGLLLGGAILLARRSGPGGVKRLFSGALHWRIGWRNWSLAVVVIPLVTIAIALVTGTYAAPPDGWGAVISDYLFITFVFGALLLNIFEETAWQGLVQRNLTREHGRLRAAALTAVPFAALHLPLSLVGDVTAGEALGSAALILLMAPAMRYVMGHTDHRTGGSLLAVGVTHASFNASGQLEVMRGGWQHIVALAVIAGVLLAIEVRGGVHRAAEHAESVETPATVGGA